MDFNTAMSHRRMDRKPAITRSDRGCGTQRRRQNAEIEAPGVFSATALLDIRPGPVIDDSDS